MRSIANTLVVNLTAALLDAAEEAEEAAEEEAIDEAAESYHREIGFDLVLVCYALIGLILVAIWAERQHVPSSLAAVLVGAALGIVLRVVGAESAPSLHSLLFFDEELFLYVLLPPIIFEAGFSVSRRFFFNNLATILLFAVPGTILTTFAIGQACQLAGAAGWFRHHDEDALDFSVPRDSFLFGALISATDPVATLSIMGAYNVDPLMYTLVAGESVLNDAVAIVLVRILKDMSQRSTSSPVGHPLHPLPSTPSPPGAHPQGHVPRGVRAPLGLLLRRPPILLGLHRLAAGWRRRRRAVGEPNGIRMQSPACMPMCD